MKKNISPVQKVLILGTMAFLLILAVSFVWDNLARTNQSKNPVLPRVQLQGEYCIKDGPWQPITNKHIPSTAGDVTLKGSFVLIDPYNGQVIEPLTPGMPVALFCDHIHVQIQEGDGAVFVADPENPVLGDDACSAFWSGYDYMGAEEVTIRIHNPHKYGNINAVDQLLDKMCLYVGFLFEDSVRSQGEPQRGIAMLFLITASILVGIAVFLLLVHFQSSQSLLMAGMITMFAGVYFLFDSPGIAFWGTSYILNTTMLGLSMMFYMLAIDAMIVSFLDSFSGKLGMAAVVSMGVAQMGIIGVPLFTDIYFYDLWLLWMILQGIVSVVLLSCLLYSIHREENKRQRLLYAGCMVPLVAYLLDAMATGFGWWQGGEISKCVFLALFAVILILVMRIIPGNINAAVRARELETEQKVLQAELQRSKVATMMSQIQPHFIYNTLSSIEQLCKEQPQEAAGLVHSFSEYLQGNFRQVEDMAPIPFAREISHVKHYTDIEQIRFADMTILYDLQATDFLIPALTVQPLVENAIKHGLMGLEEGGTVTIRSDETPTHFRVWVSDDGIGFDRSKLDQDQKHVGIRNIEGRLHAICDGTLRIESTPGKGTIACIEIPKQ